MFPDEDCAKEARAFPEARRLPTLPLIVRDELLELYAFIFCQGGFHHLGMTFEQFLLVASAINPRDLTDEREGARTLRLHRARMRNQKARRVLP
jgi:hypothetical protein